MQTLETEFQFQGRTLRQLKRVGMIAIYDVRNEGNMLYGYEVIRIKVAPAGEKFGKEYPERELYPGNEQWGKNAWSFGRNMKKEAFAVFNGLVNGSFRPQKAKNVSDLDASEGKDSQPQQ